MGVGHNGCGSAANKLHSPNGTAFVFHAHAAPMQNATILPPYYYINFCNDKIMMCTHYKAKFKVDLDSYSHNV